ncbi:MAG: hypothetical protein ACW96N_06150, partial [Candidatus Thorarchaeota archaeon]
FIRLMLEVAAKTVGVQLPDRPISEMITVRKGTEEIAPTPEMRRAPGDGEYVKEPYQESSAQGGEISSSSDTAQAESRTQSRTDDTYAIETPQVVDTRILEQARMLHLLLIVQKEGLSEVSFHLNYSGEEIDTNSVASLISALDSFGGIDGDASGIADKTDALETIEHEGNLVMVEKSDHFVMALIVTNDSAEEEHRRIMGGLLREIEHMFEDVWAKWDGSPAEFETSMFMVLTQLPLRPVSFDYVARAREAGKPLPFDNREVGKAVVDVKAAIDGTATVGGLVRSLDLPRETVIGCLQLMERFGWIDFQVEIQPDSHLRKSGEVDEETQKAYGAVVVKFVDLCDGSTALQDVVKKLNVSLPAMKFVATKLVLDGVLEVVA